MLGASFILIELLSTNKYICLYVYDTLGTMQVSIYYKDLLKRYTAIVRLRSVGSNLSWQYTSEVGYLNLLVDSNFSYTSIDLSSEMPPFVEGWKDVIDDEVVSLSYSYTVAIYVRTTKDLVASTSPISLPTRICWLLASLIYSFTPENATKNVWFKG